jgi:hypothetical protein
MPNTHEVETPIAREIHREVQQQEAREARREVCSERPAADSDSCTGEDAETFSRRIGHGFAAEL